MDASTKTALASAQSDPVVAWAVINANSLGYGAAVDTLSSFTNLIPIYGEAKMLTEGLAGQDLFSGRQLSSFERASDVLAGGLGLFASGWGAMAGEVESAGNVLYAKGNFPPTETVGGHPSRPEAAYSFDELMVGTSKYQRWVNNLTNRNYTVIEESLPAEEHAWTSSSEVHVDPSKFTYIDLLHESRHIRQYQKLAETNTNLNGMIQGWFERDAYIYELRALGGKSGTRSVSPKYISTVESRINDYWNYKGYKGKYNSSSSTKKLLDSLINFQD